MKKIGKTLPCQSSPLLPIQPRATTNSLCRTNKRERHFVSTKTIQIGNTLIPIPCFLLPHIEEFTLLTKQVGYIQAVKILAVKYNVNLEPTRQNVTRYVYPVVDIGIMPPVIQYYISFNLGKTAPITDTDIGILPPLDNWSVMRNDARYLSLCNDDTITFSTTYTEMKTQAKYWISKLPPFEAPFYYVLLKSSNRGLDAQTGCLLLKNDRIIFVPIIFNSLFMFYNVYSENTPINLESVESDSVLQTNIQEFYENVFNISCEYKKKYTRWINQ